MSFPLRTQRVTRSLSAAEVAGELGVHPASLHRWERCERSPGPGHVVGLAAVLGVDVTEVCAHFEQARRGAAARTLGERGVGLRRLRSRAAVPVARAAEAAGVPDWTVYNWESGRVRIPQRCLEPLSQVLGLPVEDLVRSLRVAPARPRPAPTSELRRLRRRTGLSQADLARRLGVSRHSVGCWERGARPPLAALRGLAAALGVPVARVARATGVEAPPLLDVRRWRPGDLPQVLRLLREWSGLTQGELARRCACSTDAVRGWEAGRAVPRPDLCRRLERLHGLPDGALLRAYPPGRTSR